MPMYEFQCGKCGKRFSVRHTFREHDRHRAENCPKCGSRTVKQLLTTVHVQTVKKS